MKPDLNQQLSEQLGEIERQGQLRHLVTVSHHDCGEIEIDLSGDEPTAFLKNQSVWRIIARVDGQPWLGGAVTLQNASTTVSPFVMLS